MLTMRQNQVEAFRHVAVQNFENRVSSHLKQFLPQLTERLGESGLRDVIQHGIKRAREYGIVRQRDVGRYIALMLMFGPYFDEKVSSGALYTILRDPRLRSSAARTAALCSAAVEALRSRTQRTGRKPIW
jgi:hypothetical protein